MTKNVMYFLRNVPFFLVAKPGEPASACPLSRNLRKAWRLFGQYDSENPTKDRHLRPAFAVQPAYRLVRATQVALFNLLTFIMRRNCAMP